MLEGERVLSRKGPPEVHSGSSRSAVIKVVPPPPPKIGSVDITQKPIRGADSQAPTQTYRTHSTQPSRGLIWRHGVV